MNNIRVPSLAYLPVPDTHSVDSYVHIFIQSAKLDYKMLGTRVQIKVCPLHLDGENDLNGIKLGTYCLSFCHVTIHSQLSVNEEFYIQ